MAKASVSDSNEARPGNTENPYVAEGAVWLDGTDEPARDTLQDLGITSQGNIWVCVKSNNPPPAKWEKRGKYKKYSWGGIFIHWTSSGPRHEKFKVVENGGTEEEPDWEIVDYGDGPFDVWEYDPNQNPRRTNTYPVPKSKIYEIDGSKFTSKPRVAGDVETDETLNLNSSGLWLDERNVLKIYDPATETWKEIKHDVLGFVSGGKVVFADNTEQTSAFTGSVAWSNVTSKPTVATESYVDTAISNLVGTAPALLNTLGELSDALNDNENFASSVSSQLSQKANTSSLSTVATSGSYTDLTNKPTIPTNLDSLTDVAITSVTDKQLIVYDQASGGWKNADAIVSSGIAYKAGFPASKNSTGTLGQIAIDGTNGVLYVCTATNTWQKVSLNAANFTNAGGFA